MLFSRTAPATATPGKPDCKRSAYAEFTPPSLPSSSKIVQTRDDFSVKDVTLLVHPRPGLVVHTGEALSEKIFGNGSACFANPSTTRFLLAWCVVTLYTTHVIGSFRHKGIEKFFNTGSKAGIQPKHAKRLGQ